VALLAVVAVITGQVLLELPAWGMLAVTVAELLPEVVGAELLLLAKRLQRLRLAARVVTVLQSRFLEFPLFTAVAVVAGVALLAALLALVVLAQVGVEMEVLMQRQTRAVGVAVVVPLAARIVVVAQAVPVWSSSAIQSALHQLCLPLLLRLVEQSQTQPLAAQTTKSILF
jgi:hypothetical protein